MTFKVPMWTSPLAMACDLDPKVVRTPALELIDERLVRAYRTPRAKLLLSMPPQEGKTWMVGRWFLIWSMWLNRRLRIGYAAFDKSLARTNQGYTRDVVTANADRLGMRLNPSFRAKEEWVLMEGGGVLGVGIGSGFTGRSVGMLVVDDPFSGAQAAASPAIREQVKTWWQSVATARLGPDAPIVVMHTRWNEDDLIGWLNSQTEGEPWDYLNIPAQADHDPAKGETDPLGREPGEFMISAQGRSLADWRQRKINAGSLQWASVYQGRPSPAEGAILKREWWERSFYDQPLWVAQSDGSRVVPGADELIITVDCAFKAREDSDYVAMGVWMRRGVDVYLLDMVNERLDFTATCNALLSLSARWPQAVLKVVEEAANGPAVMAALRGQLGGIVGEIPQGSKESRAYATTPYLEAGNVHLPAPSLAPWSTDFLEQAAMFPNGAHDDMVDTYSMAVNRLLIQPLEGEVPDARSEEEMWADTLGYSIAPY